MEALILGLYVLNACIWFGVFWFYRSKKRHSRSNGIRSLEATFRIIALTLTLYMLFCVVIHSAELGWIPVLQDSQTHYLVEAAVNLLLFGTGAVTLFLLSRRIERLDDLVAKTGLQARYHDMIEADPRMIMLFSSEGKLIEINRQGCRWMEAPDSASCTGASVLDVAARLSPEEPQELLDRIKRREMVELKWNHRILSEFEWTELQDDAGKPVGCIFCFRDVTEDRQFQREFIHSEKLAVVGQLAAATAHEIRNPLTSIKGFLQLLEHRLQGNQHEGEIREYTRIMVEEVDRMEKIIRDFLLMTKPSDAVREAVGINSLLERMLILVQNQATLRNVEVVTELRSESKVLMHREAIQQVALNLLQNAFEAMNTGGTLTLQTLEDDRYVSFKVIDTGVGMTDEEIANLGSPFYSTKTEGTGLGLTVSSKIIKEHGGRLIVESKKGEGTRITVHLPK